MIDLNGNKLELFLEPGDLLLYESAKIFHGRQQPLNGDFYDNLFVHFQPKFNRQLRRFISLFSRVSVSN